MTPSSFDEFLDLQDQLDPLPPQAGPRPISPLARLIAQNANSPVLADWATTVFAQLQAHLSLVAAKGLSRAELERLELLDAPVGSAPWEKAARKFTDMDVQSLAVHTLNAVMAAWPVIQLAGLDELQQRLILAGITLHDLNKMVGSREERQARLAGETAEVYERLVREWGERLGVWEFIALDHWADVAFLAANAEAVRGENRVLSNYQQLRTDAAELELLAPFVRLADLVASIAKHPEDIEQHQKLHGVQAELGKVLRWRYAVRHHRVSENRGLLTQVIHNAVQASAQEAGWLPWLYFPDGITYLVPKASGSLDMTNLASQVRGRLVRSVQPKLGQLVGRGGKGIEYRPEFTELLDPEQAGDILIGRTLAIISDTKTPKTSERKAKTVLRKGVNVELDLDYPGTLDSDRLAEGMFGLSRLLTDFYGGERQAHGERLVAALGLPDLLAAFQAIELTGGVGYPWYYVAGHYVQRHAGMAPGEVVERMREAYHHVRQALGPVERVPPFGFLDDYLKMVLSVAQTGEPWNFAGELARYQGSKSRGGKPVCLICNSDFGGRFLTAGPFSNRAHLGKKDSYAGICEVCQAEELLRRFVLGKTMQGEGEVKFLHLYPTYFFTSVTAAAMRQAYDLAAQATYSEVAQAFREAGKAAAGLASADLFQVELLPNPVRRLDRAEYSDTDLQAYYLLGVPYLGRDPSDTETWVMPALLGLLAPLVFGVKVVVSASARPPYPSGAAFPNKTDIVVLDAPHPYWGHAMRQDHFGLTELGLVIPALMVVYGLVADAYRDSKNYVIWNQLGHVARQLETEPLSLFGLADRLAEQETSRSRGALTNTDGLGPRLAQRLLDDYTTYTRYLHEVTGQQGVNRMAMIEKLVDQYAAFYRAVSRAAYARLRPLTLAADVILDTPPELERADLQLQMEGRLHALLDGIRDRVTQGYIPKAAYSDADRAPLVEAFAAAFLDEVFFGYCQGDRSVLRQRLNLLKNGAEAVYVKKYSRRAETPTEGDTHV